MTREKINIAELLKDCPNGMELDCTIYNGKVCFEGIDARNPACPIIKISVNLVHIERLDRWGQYSTRDYSKCVIFPKGKTTWEGFVPPHKFNDGDIVSTMGGGWIGIVKKSLGRSCETYITIYGENIVNNNSVLYFDRLATEEEKQKLFDAIKANGYKWNAGTKTLEKLIEPKFKVGDSMNDIQLYNFYLHIPLWHIGSPTRIYPKYVVHMGRSFFGPNPHRHYSFEEFIDKLNKDPNFKNVILNK